jgi:signal transduction histidine kinase
VNLSTPDIVVIAVAVVAVLLIIAAIVMFVRRRKRRDELKDRYGRAEYDRAVDRTGSERRAEEQLSEREARRQSYDIRELSSGERATMRGRFEAIESSFVDAPEAAVRSADSLLDEVAELRGYPEAPAQQRLDDLSVDHPAAADRYRRSRARAGDGGTVTTEQHRQALIGSRALFEALVGRDGNEGEDAPPSFRDIVVEEDDREHADNGHRRHEPSQR